MKTIKITYKDNSSTIYDYNIEKLYAIISMLEKDSSSILKFEVY